MEYKDSSFYNELSQAIDYDNAEIIALEYNKKLKKDFIVLYLARNGIMTFLITLFTFSLDLSNYYQISFPATIPYIFFNNIFTL